MVAILGYTKAQIFDAVKAMYTEVATRPDAPYHFPTGPKACRQVGYPADLIAALPRTAVESFAGVGYPFRAGLIRHGDTVLDIGGGSGTDAIIASRLAGPQGKVLALDITPAMREKLTITLAEAGIDNVTPLEGQAESIPLPDASVDVVISNGVLNLVPDKRRAIAEIFRVLRPGGGLQIADIVIASPVTPDCEDDPKLWAECVVGATVDEDYLNLFRDAGFEDVTVLRDYDYFAFSPSTETQAVARRFGAHAVELTMRRGARAPARIVRFARRIDPRRLAKAVQRRGLGGMLALLLAVLACYGTLALIAALSLLGITLVVHEGAWAAAIVSFSLLAAAVVGLGMRRHRSVGPLVPALAGAGLIIYVMFSSYSRVIEIAGFALLGLATFWDFRLRRAVSIRESYTTAPSLAQQRPE